MNTKNFIVIRLYSQYDNTHTLHIVNEKNYKSVQLSNCYDSNGQKNGKDYKNLWVKAHNYHDGHNWRSLILGENYSNGGFVQAEREDDEELESEILEDLKNKKSVGDSGGYQYYEGKKYSFIMSNWQTSGWEVYQVEEKRPVTYDFKYEFIGLQYLIIHLKGSCSKYQGEFWGHEWSEEGETAANWAMENFGVENGKMCHPREEKNENCIYFEL
jgi:hypothetical protein